MKSYWSRITGILRDFKVVLVSYFLKNLIYLINIHAHVSFVIFGGGFREGGFGAHAPPLFPKKCYIHLCLALEAPKSLYHCHAPPLFKNPGSATANCNYRMPTSKSMLALAFGIAIWCHVDIGIDISVDIVVGICVVKILPRHRQTV